MSLRPTITPNPKRPTTATSGPSATVASAPSTVPAAHPHRPGAGRGSKALLAMGLDGEVHHRRGALLPRDLRDLDRDRPVCAPVGPGPARLSDPSTGTARSPGHRPRGHAVDE